MTRPDSDVGGTEAGSNAGPIRIVVHDYAGHPFQRQLARVLAGRGHHVLHLHSTTFQTPNSALARQPSDPPRLAVDGIDLGEPFHKYNFVRRLFQERRYGRLLVDRLATFEPDVIVSANTPLDAQARALNWAKRNETRFVFWLQDVYSVAIERTLEKRLSLLGRLIARRFVRLEGYLLRRSDAVVAITEDFKPVLQRWGIEPGRISVIENWAPLDEITPHPKKNGWSVEHALADVPVFLYAGTLGLKHDPSLILRLAQGVPDARVVVVSEGIGADWLREHGSGVANLQILPFQPFARLSEVLATGDVLLAILEPDAGVFSVPSKVLTSLAAGRAILGAIPLSNLAARTIQRAKAGTVVDPGDREGFVRAGQSMMADRAAREASAQSARRYAETNFDIETIADRFEQILRDALTTGSLSDKSRNSGAARSHGGPGVQEDGS